MSGLNERSKREIALLAGGDLESELCLEAQQSINTCPNCREHWVRMRGCLDILDRVGRTVDPVPEASLWPSLEARLKPMVTRPSSAAQDFNGWIPALSMAAACIALLIAGRFDGSAPHDFDGPGQETAIAGGVQHFPWREWRPSRDTEPPRAKPFLVGDSDLRRSNRPEVSLYHSDWSYFPPLSAGMND